MRCHAVATTGYANAEHIVILQAALFERFKESNDDYLTQARIIIFGLKENAPMRDRLFSGAMHCLEFAYADDAVSEAVYCSTTRVIFTTAILLVCLVFLHDDGMIDAINLHKSCKNSLTACVLGLVS